ncbi:MAG: periplasmic heavy metal sensor [bacterium]|nr:periplasmic heavy metal sensor [bacterium]
MSFFSKGRFTNGMVFLLVLVNLALLATFWYSRSKPAGKEIEKVKKSEGIRKQPDDRRRQPGQDDPDARGREERQRAKEGERLARFLETELNFTQDQVKKFLDMREKHHQKTATLRKQMDDLRKEMMGHLLDEDLDKEKVEALAKSVGEKMAALEKGMFYHLLDLVKMGDSLQQTKYKTLMHEILEQFRPADHKGPPKGGPPGRRRPRGERDDRRPGERPPGGHQGQGPPRGERGNPQPPGDLMRKLRDELSLSESQWGKIRPIVEAAFKKLEFIPTQYAEHHERREAKDAAFRDMDKRIEALLTEEQKRKYRQIEKDNPPPPQR